VRIHATYRSRPKIGEVASGDAVVARVGPSSSLFAVIDALGHGPVAEAVAKKAMAVLESVALDRGVVEPLEAVHEALRGTRGAALTLGIHRHGTRTIECAGVGNVSARGLVRSIAFAPTPGVLGSKLGKPRSVTLDMRAGDALLVVSDGIPRRAIPGSLAAMSPERLCEDLMAQSHSHDDATVLLVHWE
jgi:hypothetical protein